MRDVFLLFRFLKHPNPKNQAKILVICFFMTKASAML